MMFAYPAQPLVSHPPPPTPIHFQPERQGPSQVQPSVSVQFAGTSAQQGQQDQSLMDAYGADTTGMPTYQAIGAMDGHVSEGERMSVGGAAVMGNGSGNANGSRVDSNAVGWSFDTFMNLAPALPAYTSNNAQSIALPPSSLMGATGKDLAETSLHTAQQQHFFTTSDGMQMDMTTSQLQFPSNSYIQPVDMDHRQPHIQIQVQSQGQAVPQLQLQLAPPSMSPKSALHQPIPQQSRQVQIAAGLQEMPMDMAAQQGSWIMEYAPKDESSGGGPSYPCPAVNLATGSRFSQLLEAKLGNIPSAPFNPSSSGSSGFQFKQGSDAAPPFGSYPFPPAPNDGWPGGTLISSSNPRAHATSFWSQPMAPPGQAAPSMPPPAEPPISSMPVPAQESANPYRISPEVQAVPIPTQPSCGDDGIPRTYGNNNFSVEMAATGSSASISIPTGQYQPPAPLQGGCMQGWQSYPTVNGIVTPLQTHGTPLLSVNTTTQVPALLRFRSPTVSTVIQTPVSGMRPVFSQHSSSPLQMINNLSASPGSNTSNSKAVESSPIAGANMPDMHSSMGLGMQAMQGFMADDNTGFLTAPAFVAQNVSLRPDIHCNMPTDISPYGLSVPQKSDSFVNMPFIPGGTALYGGDGKELAVPAYPEMVYMDAIVPAKLPRPPTKSQSPPRTDLTKMLGKGKGKGKGPKMSFSLAVPSSAGIQVASASVPMNQAAGGTPGGQGDSSDFRAREGSGSSEQGAGGNGHNGGSGNGQNGGSGNGDAGGTGGTGGSGGSGGFNGGDHGSNNGSAGDDNSNAHSESWEDSKKPTIACYNCRSKKLKCDGARPKCHHCTRRGEDSCAYDTVLRRRGPGKKTKDKEREKELVRARAREEALNREVELRRRTLLGQSGGSSSHSNEHSPRPEALPSPSDILAGVSRTASPPYRSTPTREGSGIPPIPYTFGRPIPASMSRSPPHRDTDYPPIMGELESVGGRRTPLPRAAEHEARAYGHSSDGRARYETYEYSGQYDRERRYPESRVHVREYPTYERDERDARHHTYSDPRQQGREHDYRYAPPGSLGASRRDIEALPHDYRQQEDRRGRYDDREHDPGNARYRHRSISPTPASIAPYKLPPYTLPQHHSNHSRAHTLGNGREFGQQHDRLYARADERYSGYGSASGSDDYGPSERDRWAMGYREAPRVREESC